MGVEASNFSQRRRDAEETQRRHGEGSGDAPNLHRMASETIVELNLGFLSFLCVLASMRGKVCFALR